VSCLSQPAHPEFALRERLIGPLERAFVHLAYLDDSDTRGKRQKWQVMSAVIMEDRNFKIAEVGMSCAQEQLGLSPEQLEKFEEFHACELYGGHKFFEQVEQERRFDALYGLLTIVKVLKFGIVFGAVNLEYLQQSLYGSADPLDMCFRMCLGGITSWTEKKNNDRVLRGVGEDWSNENLIHHTLEGVYNDLTVLIVDECSDKRQREVLHRTFREFRSQKNCSETTMLNPLHDDMYFGDSRYSLGIQIADACSYFIGRHLEGDRETESFYEIIEPFIEFSQVYPPKEEAPAAPPQGERR
jgi:Protein of unknown function (DUF3800)